METWNGRTASEHGWKIRPASAEVSSESRWAVGFSIKEMICGTDASVHALLCTCVHVLPVWVPGSAGVPRGTNTWMYVKKDDGVPWEERLSGHRMPCWGERCENVPGMLQNFCHRTPVWDLLLACMQSAWIQPHLAGTWTAFYNPCVVTVAKPGVTVFLSNLKAVFLACG